MRSIAEQSVSELGGPRSVLTRQRADHIKLHSLLSELSACPAEQSRPLLIRIYRLVFPHAFAEEAVLWPVLRRLPDGHELTLQVEREHQRINELVMQLEGLSPGSPEWREVLDEVVPLLLQDVRDEEDLLLPRLQQALGAGQMRLLGTQWAFVRAIAPTRSHPIVSRRPPGNVLAALPLSVLDRARDRIEMRQQGRTTRLSVSLARAARSVEQLPMMKAGEDASTRVSQPPTSKRKKAVFIVALAATGVLLGRRVLARPAAEPVA
jgi:hypothetical protein